MISNHIAESDVQNPPTNPCKMGTASTSGKCYIPFVGLSPFPKIGKPDNLEGFCGHCMIYLHYKS